ncbi:MAG: hypothetical protein J5697_02110 [Clostridia bacterium]|nr:hypothetical protein [Clostridia bacterium]
MENKWIVVYGKYEGLEKKALNLINATVSDLYKNYLPFYRANDIDRKTLYDNNLIIVGTITDNKYLKEYADNGNLKIIPEEQAFSISVDESRFNKDKQSIAILGYDEKGVLYGAVDFINKYCGDLIYKAGIGDLQDRIYFESPFKNKAPKWSYSSAPSVKERAIWTWGHVIYDYRSFFDNMVLLKLNEIVIWNDYAPINADDIVDYAHSLGIKVIWGFAWGWDTDCKTSMRMTEKGIEELKENIINRFEIEYAHRKGDGIYFQSCTELGDEYIDGRLIAAAVVDLVNKTGRKLLEKYPDLKLQFGLHATSVKNKLEYIAQVDERITIVWENCGEAFPFINNIADQKTEKQVSDIPIDADFLKKICTLRGENEKIGFVLKGMSGLDWTTFSHQPENIVLGEKSDSFIDNRLSERRKIWKLRQANWIYNCEKARETVKLITENAKDVNVQGLIEDGMFEKEIPLPAAIYAETLWDSEKSGKDILNEVIKFPCVKAANI